jgi:hypothetical protein
MTENEFRNTDEVQDSDYNFRSDLTLEEVQLVFHERMKFCKCVSEHDGEFAPEWTWQYRHSSSTQPGKAKGQRLSCAPV